VKDHLKKWGVVYASLALFLTAWIAQFFTQMQVVANEAAEHQQQFSWGEFWPQYFASTFENWQSEFLQIAWQAFAVSALASFWFRKSKEDTEQMKRDLAHIKGQMATDPSVAPEMALTPALGDGEGQR
jgi:hypothetical protein